MAISKKAVVAPASAPAESRQSSHLGAGLMAGAIIGMATGLFIQSRKGKELTKDAQKKAMQLQVKVIKKLKAAKGMTKEKYIEIVDDVVGYYEKSQEIAKKEVPVVRDYLLKRWKMIEGQLKDIVE